MIDFLLRKTHSDFWLEVCCNKKAVDPGAQTMSSGLGPAGEWLLGGENSLASPKFRIQSHFFNGNASIHLRHGKGSDRAAENGKSHSSTSLGIHSVPAGFQGTELNSVLCRQDC